MINDPIPNLHVNITRLCRALSIVFIASLLLVVSGCGSEEAAPTVAPEGPTSTSSAILAATATSTIESATATNATEPAADNEGAEVATASSIESDDNTDEADISEPVIICDKEIALDLVGHPQYTELFNQLGCPLDSASLEPVAINEFGPGPEYDRFMLWFSTTNQIYVLRPDRSWTSFNDTWTEDEAEIMCNPTDGEMTSPPLPRRGFGKLWCADETLQEVMGTIVREERLCQHTVLQDFEEGQLLGCFEDATIRYLQIFNDGTWDMKFVQ